MQTPEVVESIHDSEDLVDRLERLERAVYGAVFGTAPALTNEAKAARVISLRDTIAQLRRELARAEEHAYDKRLDGGHAERGEQHGAAGIDLQVRINELRTSIDLFGRELASLEA